MDVLDDLTGLRIKLFKVNMGALHGVVQVAWFCTVLPFSVFAPPLARFDLDSVTPQFSSRDGSCFAFAGEGCGRAHRLAFHREYEGKNYPATHPFLGARLHGLERFPKKEINDSSSGSNHLLVSRILSEICGTLAIDGEILSGGEIRSSDDGLFFHGVLYSQSVPEAP